MSEEKISKIKKHLNKIEESLKIESEYMTEMEDVIESKFSNVMIEIQSVKNRLEEVQSVIENLKEAPKCD